MRIAVRTLGSLLLFAALAAPAAASPPAAIVTGQDAGWPDVRAWDARGGPVFGSAPWGGFPLAFSPYPTYQNGVRVAVGDLDGDRRAEIVAAPGGAGFTELRVFDGRTFAQRSAFLPFRNGVWWNGAFVAVGDTTGDGRGEIVDGLDAGCCTTLHVLDAADGRELSGFFPFGDRDVVGARVASADLGGDGKAELLAVPVGSTRVRAFAPTGGAPFRLFEPFGAEATGGAAIAAGDVTGDAHPELVAAAPTAAGVQAKVVDVQTGATLASFAPFGASLAAVPEVAVADVDGDGKGDVVVLAQRSDGTQLKVLDRFGRQLASFYVLDPDVVPGASLAAGDLDGDGRAEIVLGAGRTGAPSSATVNGPDQRIAVYRLDGTRRGAFTAYPGLFQGGVRVALANLDDEPHPEIVTAPGSGLEPEVGIFGDRWLETRERGLRIAHFLAYEESFRGGVSVAAGDVTGDGVAEIVTAPGAGRVAEIRIFDARGRLQRTFAAFEQDVGGLSVAVGDLDADGKAEIVVGTLAAPGRFRAFSAMGAPLGPLVSSGDPDAGARVGVADVDGTGRGLVVTGAATGEHPAVALLDPFSGAIRRSAVRFADVANGVYVAGGDLDRDGRDEILVAPGWGGDGRVRILGGTLSERYSFAPYSFGGAGMSVAGAARVGLPILANGRTVRLRARRPARVVVARFVDAAGASHGLFRARIAWGDGTSWSGAVLSRGGGVYDVRSTKRYARTGRYAVTVTLTDGSGRTSVARGTALVRRR